MLLTLDECLAMVTLVDELVESMLSVGSRLSPHDWASVVVYTGSMISDVFTI